MSFPPLQRSPTILAIDPGTRHIGVAVLTAPELVYYGVKSFRGERPADALIRATRAALQDLIAAHRPSILAYEKTFYVQAKRSALLHVQEAEIIRVGRLAGLRVVGYPPTRVRKLLCQDGRATKREVARLLVDRFPELGRYRTAVSPRQETYWLNMFDAIAVGVVCSDAIEPESAKSDRRATA